MLTNSQSMKVALKDVVVPVLRSIGFKGSLPHFRRINEDKIDLLTFQFDKYGGGFVIEISSCSSVGITMPWGLHIPPNKVTAHDTLDRSRLLPHDGWFSFENQPCAIVADSVIPYIHKAEELWKAGIKIGNGLKVIVGL